MPVTEGRRKSWVLHGIAVSLLGLFIVLSGLYGVSALLGCPDCGGTGLDPQHYTVESPSEDGAAPEQHEHYFEFRCDTCAGVGHLRLTRKTLAAMFPRVCAALWGCVCVTVALGLLWGMNVVECGLCGGSGRLALEAVPPGEAAFRIDLECVACGGRGWLGRLDRWVLGRS
jgi:DnaJ-class molecular chaperone